jgi:hypothetical protein
MLQMLALAVLAAHGHRLKMLLLLLLVRRPHHRNHLL